MDTRLATPLRVLQVALGLTATLAGLDKFFNILADWGSDLSPGIATLLPVSVPTFMGIIGTVEIAVGASILGYEQRVAAPALCNAAGRFFRSWPGRCPAPVAYSRSAASVLRRGDESRDRRATFSYSAWYSPTEFAVTPL